MKSSTRLTHVLVLILFASATHGAQYFVCNNHSLPSFNGSDSNDGLAPERAWRTFQHAHQQFVNLQGGDTLAFCRGGTFQTTETNGHVFFNGNSSASSPITITSYIADASDNSCYNLPRIEDHLDGAIFRFNNPAHDEGYVLEQLQLLGGAGSTSNEGIMIARDSDHITLRHLEISGMSLGIYIGSGGDFSGDSDGSNSDISIQAVYLHDNFFIGFLGKAENLLIEDSVFDNNASRAPIFGHNIYITKAVFQNDHDNYPYITQHQVIRNNLIHRSAVSDHDNNPATADECDASSLTVHGVQRHTLIENNVVWEEAYRANGTCFGIAVIPGYNYEYPEGFANTRILNNIVMNMGRESISCSACDDSEIANNLIIARSDEIALRAINVGQGENSYFPCENAQANNPPGCQLEHHYDLLDKTRSVSVHDNRILLDTSNGVSRSQPILAGDDDGILDHFEFYNNRSWYSDSARVDNGDCTVVEGSDSNSNNNEHCQVYPLPNPPAEVMTWQAEAMTATEALPEDGFDFFQSHGLFNQCTGDTDTVFLDSFENQLD